MEVSKVVSIKNGTAPMDFMEDPFLYFESRGKNARSGEKLFDSKGRLRDDPTAVKIIPWTNGEQVIAKKVNIEKGMVRKLNDPFYEAEIMEAVLKAGLPAAKLIACVEQSGRFMIVMEKVGLISYWDMKKMNRGDFLRIMWQARRMMAQLASRFRKAGFVRSWKLNDLLFKMENNLITEIIPVDWEKTKFDKLHDVYGQRVFSRYQNEHD